MRAWPWVVALATVAGGACGDPPAEERREAVAAPGRGSDAAAGQCAVDPRTGAFIGEILAAVPDPETGEPAYRVRLETDPGEVGYVGTGVRVVDCAPLRRERAEPDPEAAL